MPFTNDRRRIAATAAVSKLYADDRARVANGEDARGVRHDEVADAVLAAIDAVSQVPFPFLSFSDLGHALPAAHGDPPHFRRLADDAVIVRELYVVPMLQPGEERRSLHDKVGVRIVADLEHGGVNQYRVIAPDVVIGFSDDEPIPTPNARVAVRTARKILGAAADRETRLAAVEKAAVDARHSAPRLADEEFRAELEAEGLL